MNALHDQPSFTGVTRWNRELCTDYRPVDDRRSCSRVTGWTHADHEVYRGMNGNTSITTVTVEPDGTGTLTVDHERDPSNSRRMEATDVSVENDRLEPLESGRWEPLLESPVLTTTPPPGRS